MYHGDIIETLIKAKAKLATEDKWTRGDYAVGLIDPIDGDMYEFGPPWMTVEAGDTTCVFATLPPNDRRCTRFCAAGAVLAAMNLSDDDALEAEPVLRALAAPIAPELDLRGDFDRAISIIAKVNDREDTTLADIHNMFDVAITRMRGM